MTAKKKIISKRKQRPRYFVDLFAGCGGLSLGLEQAEWTPVFVNELNKDALETYLLNRDEEFPELRSDKMYIQDIKELVKNDGKLLKELKAKLKSGPHELDWSKHDIDLVCGGPPCQGFSGIGHRRSYSVNKAQLPSNHLFQDMAFVVNELQPKMFLFENVRGLLNAKWTSDGKKGEIWQDILSTFKQIEGYRVGWRLIFAKDYGVPQNRPRVLMVGVREDLGIAFKSDSEDALEAGLLPKGEGNAPDLVDLLGDLVKEPFVNGDTVAAYPKKAKPPTQKLLRKGAPRKLTEHEYSHHSDKILAKFRAMHENNGTIPEKMRTKKFAQRLLPKRWGKDGPSITACSLADDYVHFSQPRALTVREWARLQMFPDRYQFAGKRTTGGLRRAGNPREGIFDRELPKYTQIGNAVPVKLAYDIGMHFRHLLSSGDENALKRGRGTRN